jgi:hypothetical protein
MRTRLVTDSTECVIETMVALDGDPSVRGIAVFVADGLAGRSSLDSTLRRLSTTVFGGVFPRVIHRGEAHETAAVVAGLAVEPRVTVVSDLDDPKTDVAATLPDAAPRDGTAFVFVDAHASRVEHLVGSLFDAYGVTLNYVGGGAGSLDAPEAPCLLTGDGLLADAAVVATVDLSTDVGVRHGWEAIAGPLRVTAAEGRTVHELDGERAFSAYREIVGEELGPAETVDVERFFEVARRYPFGIARLEGERIVRDPFELDDGSITCFGDVPDGEFLHVLCGDTESLVAAASAAHTAVDGDAAEVLFFDCISRVLFLGDEFHRELDAVGGPDEPTIGALTIGEIANDGEGHLDYYNKTAVVAAIDGL